ncbi:MAG: hypothetical protein V2I79_10900 [Xanthomonadales bacterium]|jgi:hypothetical protein|nr:hypothetical protein [Xanthomonadales bacterium]
MKRAWPILLILVFSACSGPTLRDGGDGVYYASSPPAYVYVDSYVGFRYFGPYAWSWYHPVWYSPLAGGHYYWRWATGAAPLISGKDRLRHHDFLPGSPVAPGQLAVVPVDSRVSMKNRFHDNTRRKYAGSAKSPSRIHSHQSSHSMRRATAPSTTSRMARPSSAPRNSEHEH